MQKKRLLKIVVISLFALLLISISVVYAYQTHETFICRKSVTVKAGEIAVVTFYMPAEYGEIWEV